MKISLSLKFERGDGSPAPALAALAAALVPLVMDLFRPSKPSEDDWAPTDEVNEVTQAAYERGYRTGYEVGGGTTRHCEHAGCGKQPKWCDEHP